MNKQSAKNSKTNQPQSVVYGVADRRVALSDHQRQEMNRADRLSKSEKFSERREAMAIRRQVERELKETAEGLSVASGILEAVELEIDRGGEVDFRPPVGRCQMKDRDGLRSLFDCGKLTRAEYETGMRYRKMTEAAFSGGKSQLAGSVGGGNVDIVGMGFSRAKAATMRTRIDIAVVTNMTGEPIGLLTLRTVAGEGQAMRSLAKGKAFDRYVRALKSALYVAERVMDG